MSPHPPRPWQLLARFLSPEAPVRVGSRKRNRTVVVRTWRLSRSRVCSDACVAWLSGLRSRLLTHPLADSQVVATSRDAAVRMHVQVLV